MPRVSAPGNCSRCGRFIWEGTECTGGCPPPPPKSDTKRCTACKERKPLSAFNRDRSRGDGLQPKCRQCDRDASRRASQRNPKTRRAKERAWRRRNPQKVKAHSAVAYALRSGRLVRPNACPECGEETLVEAHHPDYDKPLEVEWLCGPCHRVRHGREIRDAA
jgi:ribosomal protein S27AE